MKKETINIDRNKNNCLYIKDPEYLIRKIVKIPKTQMSNCALIN